MGFPQKSGPLKGLSEMSSIFDDSGDLGIDFIENFEDFVEGFLKFSIFGSYLAFKKSHADF